jgi:hypothetical protein
MVRTSRTTGARRAGCSKRLSSKAAASEEARRTLRYVELLSEARTTLADFFNILLVVRAYEGESIVSRRAEKRGAGQLC